MMTAMGGSESEALRDGRRGDDPCCCCCLGDGDPFCCCGDATGDAAGDAGLRSSEDFRLGYAEREGTSSRERASSTGVKSGRKRLMRVVARMSAAEAAAMATRAQVRVSWRQLTTFRTVGSFLRTETGCEAVSAWPERGCSLVDGETLAGTPERWGYTRRSLLAPPCRRSQFIYIATLH